MAGRKARAVWVASGVTILLVGLSLWLVFRARPVAVTNAPATEPAKAGQSSVAGAGGAKEGDASISKALDTAVGHTASAPDKSPGVVDIVLALSNEMCKRQAIIASLAPYSDEAAALKDEIRKANGGAITKDMVEGLTGQAKALEEDYWNKGDFDNAASFDSIYRARATLELCLDADPTNEAALRQIIEVLGAGWPFFLNGQEGDAMRMGTASDALKKTVSRNYEGYYALYDHLWTLWSTRLSKNSDATVEDLAVVADLLSIRPPDDRLRDLDTQGAFRAIDDEYRRQHPEATPEQVAEARRKVSSERCAQAAQWALEACRRKGAAWERYANGFSFFLRKGAFLVPIKVVSDPKEPVSDKVRYWGRLDSFEGPPRRSALLVPTYKALANAPKQ